METMTQVLVGVAVGVILLFLEYRTGWFAGRTSSHPNLRSATGGPAKGQSIFRKFAIVTVVVVILGWLFVQRGWVTDDLISRVSQWIDAFSSTVSSHELTLEVSLFVLFVTGTLILRARRIGSSKGAWTVVTVVAAIWLATGIGWALGEWSGILAITMPSLIILIAGLMALPPFVLPVAPLHWKAPIVVAVLYNYLWLVSQWVGWLEMNAIGLIVFLAGLFVILRPAFPIERTSSLVAVRLFIDYGFTTFVIWRWIGGFELNNTLNLLVLIQGVLALSCYVLPVVGRNRLWAWQLAILFGAGYLFLMFSGNIPATVTNGLILLLGLAAFVRFAIPHDEKDRRWTDMATVLIFVQNGFTWAIGLAAGQLPINWFSALTFGIGFLTTLMPAFVAPSANWAAFRAIITYNLGTNYPYLAVPFRELVTRAEGDPFANRLAGPGIVLSNADHAVVVYGGGSFARVSPPGLTFTHWAEQVQGIVDLRPQIRLTPSIVAKTKDGIDVEVVAGITFRIETDGQEPTLGSEFPYDEIAIYRAVYLDWNYLVCQTCESFLLDIVSTYTLDELCGVYDPARDPRAEITAIMRIALSERVKEWGLELFGVEIGNITPPQEVIRQRIENWKSYWEDKIKLYETKAKAVEKYRLEIARAEAQLEIVLRISEKLEQLPTPYSAHGKKLTALSILDVVNEVGSSDPGLVSQIGPRLQGFQDSLASVPREDAADGVAP